MNKVDRMRRDLAKEVLCCFTCYYSIKEKSNLECTLNMDDASPIADSDICMNWSPDVRAEGQADWGNLLEALKERRKGDQA